MRKKQLQAKHEAEKQACKREAEEQARLDREAKKRRERSSKEEGRAGAHGTRT